MAKAKTATSWAPLEGAVETAKEINERARKAAEETASELRKRSEAALTTTQKRSKEAVDRIRTGIAAAQKAVDEQREQIGKLPELVLRQLEAARSQVAGVESNLKAGLEQLARGLNLATVRDLEGLTRRLAQLEKRLVEVELQASRKVAQLERRIDQRSGRAA